MMRLALSALAALLAAGATAQLPRGHAVYSRMYNPVAPSVEGGLVMFHPFHGSYQPITGLPGLLTGAAYVPWPSSAVGCNAVLVDDENGTLFVAPVVSNGHPLEIYHVMPVGSAAVVLATHLVGTPTNFAAIDQMAWLPGGEILFSHRGAMPGYASQGIARLDPATGTVASVPVSPFPSGTLNALAVDPAGTTAYLGLFGGGSHVYSVPLPGGGAPFAILASPISGAISQLHVDCTGQLYAGGQGSVGLRAIDPATGTSVQLTPFSGLNAMAVDEVSGDFLLAHIQAAASNSHMDRYDGTLTTIAGMSSIDSPTGLAIRSSLYTYGSAPPSAPVTATWRTCQNPGGAPVIPTSGTTPFSITLDVTPNTGLGLLGFSLMPLASTSLPGPLTLSNLLIDPTQRVGPIVVLLPGSSTHTVPLSIPAGIGAFELFAQPLHFDANLSSLIGGEALVIALH